MIGIQAQEPWISRITASPDVLNASGLLPELGTLRKMDAEELVRAYENDLV